MENPNTTVIITLNWNGWETTARLLRSILKTQMQFPVWVVDNGSTEKTPDKFVAEFPIVKLISLDSNHGFAGGMNRAISKAIEAGFDFVYEINNDCLVLDDVVTPTIEVACKDLSIAVVGSRYLSKDQNDEYTEWGFRSAPEYSALYVNDFLREDRVVGCGMLLRCSAFQELGGFDERFFCYGEENDYCWRAIDKGWVVGMCFSSLVMHDHKGSDVGGNAAYYGTRNVFLLHRKHTSRYKFPANDIKRAVERAWTGLRQGHIHITTSCVQGLNDGLFGRYGIRENTPNYFVAKLCLFLWTTLYIPICLVDYVRRGWRKITPSR